MNNQPNQQELHTADVVGALRLKSIGNELFKPNYLHQRTNTPLVVYGHRHPTPVFFELGISGVKNGEVTELAGRQQRHAASGAKYVILCAGSGEVFFLDPGKYWEWGYQRRNEFPQRTIEHVWEHTGLEFADSSRVVVIPISALRNSPAVRYYYPSVKALAQAASKWA